MFDDLSSILIFSGVTIALLLYAYVYITRSIDECIFRCEIIRKGLELEIAAREEDEAEKDNDTDRSNR